MNYSKKGGMDYHRYSEGPSRSHSTSRAGLVLDQEESEAYPHSSSKPNENQKVKLRPYVEEVS